MRTGRIDLGLAAALAIGLLSVVPFIVLDGRLILEPDLLASQIVFFHDAFRDWTWFSLPAPAAGSTYFEGNLILHGLATLLYRAAYSLFAPPPPVYDSARVAAGLVNAVMSVAASGVFFATARRLAGDTVIALLITVLFVLSPQLVDIDLVRADRVMILPLIVVLHVSVLITQGAARPRDGAYLGLAMALLCTVKFNGVFFAAFPASALALGLLWPSDSATRRKTGAVAGAAFLAGIPFLILLMIRFVLHPGEFLQFLKIGYDTQIVLFLAFSPYTPRLYYNIDLFLGYGRLFLGLVFLATLVVMGRAVTRRDRTCIWLIVNLLVFSAAGIVVFKYARAGYHFVPLYLYALAIAAGVLRDFLRAQSRPRVAAALAVASIAALLIVEATVVVAFERAAQIGWQRPISVARTRLDSRAWIAARFQPGDRICMIVDSQWSAPHLDGLGLFVVTATFDFRPYRTDEMAAYRAPRMTQVKAACDGIVFEDLHKTVMNTYFRTNRLDQRLREWEDFYRQLEHDYPAKTFVAETPAYNVSSVEVHDLRAAPQDEAGAADWMLRLSRRAVLEGILADGALKFADVTVPVGAGRFTGSVDSAQRYDRKYLLLNGWAADTAQQEPASAIVVVQGARVVGYDGTATGRRPDVAAYLRDDHQQLAGFVTCVAYDGDTPPKVFALGAADGAGPIAAAEGIAITEMPLGSPLPEACRSSDWRAFW